MDFQKRQSRPNERHLRRRAEMPSTVAALNRARWLKYNRRFCIAQLRRFQRIFYRLTAWAMQRTDTRRSRIGMFRSPRALLIRGCRRGARNATAAAISFKTRSFDCCDLGTGPMPLPGAGVNAVPDRAGSAF